MNPKISFIIPALNEEKFLPKLLSSLAGQTQKDFEVIVVDGRSSDKTVMFAQEFKNQIPSLTVLVAPKPGLPLQRNLGAASARGEWLIFVDADSILMPYFVERAFMFIESNTPQVFTTWAQPDSTEVADSIFTLFLNLIIEGSILLKRPFSPGPLTAVRRDIFEKVGGYDEAHRYNEDVDLALRIHAEGIPLSVIRETLYVWSMRRIRHEGKMKVVQQYVVSAMPILFFKRPLSYMPGYIMGGQLYGKKKKPSRMFIKKYEQKLKNLVKEFFE